MAYRTVLSTLEGEVVEEVPAKNLAFSYVLNRPGALSFTVPRRHPKCRRDILDPGKREVRLFRDDVLVWGGYLWHAQTGQEEGHVIRFSVEGWFSRVHRRHVDSTKNYNGVDQTAIAWDLLNFTQGKADGNLGITNGSSPSGVTRDRVYEETERKNIGEAIEELSEVIDGFDFEVTADKVFRTYYPKKGSTIAQTFELGKNIRNYSMLWDAGKTATEITAIGAPIEISGSASNNRLAVAVDTPARAVLGLLQDSRQFPDVSIQSTLQGHANEELRLAKHVREIPILQLVTDDPPFGSYSIGDEARVKIDAGYTQVDTIRRITTITVSISNEGHEAIGLFFDEGLE